MDKKEHVIKELKQKIVEVGNGRYTCCCDELRTIFDEKEKKLHELSNYWRTKTQQLISLS